LLNNQQEIQIENNLLFGSLKHIQITLALRFLWHCLLRMVPHELQRRVEVNRQDGGSKFL
jgi:hypothetical protein